MCCRSARSSRQWNKQASMQAKEGIVSGSSKRKGKPQRKPVRKQGNP
jgi:hypothetical protein